VDYEPHAVHTAQRHEDSSLRMTPGGKFMCQAPAVLLSWRLLVAKRPHNS
jgi:hypothetical protein